MCDETTWLCARRVHGALARVAFPGWDGYNRAALGSPAARRYAGSLHDMDGVIVARKKSVAGDFTLFDVLYEDGSRRSNRRVPSALLGGLDGDEPARTHIEAQDAEIAERSGQPAGRIKTIARAGELDSPRGGSKRYGGRADAAD